MAERLTIGRPTRSASARRAGVAAMPARSRGGLSAVAAIENTPTPLFARGSRDPRPRFRAGSMVHHGGGSHWLAPGEVDLDAVPPVFVVMYLAYTRAGPGTTRARDANDGTVPGETDEAGPLVGHRRRRRRHARTRGLQQPGDDACAALEEPRGPRAPTECIEADLVRDTQVVVEQRVHRCAEPRVTGDQRDLVVVGE